MKKQLAVAIAALALCSEFGFAADFNIDINTPPTVVVKHSMAQRHSRLIRFYDAGVIGLTKTGDLAICDGTRLKMLVQRQTAEKLIDADTEDRKSLVHAIAYSLKQPDAQPEIRNALIERWRKEWKSGWCIQDEQGNWTKKP